MTEAELMQELENIRANQPLWPGHVLNLATANELFRRGWIRQDKWGHYALTSQAPENSLCVLQR